MPPERAPRRHSRDPAHRRLLQMKTAAQREAEREARRIEAARRADEKMEAELQARRRLGDRAEMEWRWSGDEVEMEWRSWRQDCAACGPSSPT